MKRKLSKVEIDGIEALVYDEMMQILTGFTYNRFIKRVIADMNISSGDSILDLGCGTGKNICLMTEYTSNLIVGFDTSKNMLKQAKARCKGKNVKIFYHDIRTPSPFVDCFDIVFISFVLHGFIDTERDKIIENTFRALKPSGKFCILDYNEFDLNKRNPLVRFVFKYGECPLATEFIGIDLKNKLRRFGFKEFTENFYYSNLVRLLVAYK